MVEPMKQQITEQQFYELSREKRRVLRHWGFDRGYNFKMFTPTIGKMLEFLREKIEQPVNVMIWDRMARVETTEDRELCDAL